MPEAHRRRLSLERELRGEKTAPLRHVRFATVHNVVQQLPPVRKIAAGAGHVAHGFLIDQDQRSEERRVGKEC